MLRQYEQRGFMFSLVGFHVFPTRVACFPSKGFMFSLCGSRLCASRHVDFVRRSVQRVSCFPRGVSCFPYQGFMFSREGFHVFPALCVCFSSVGARPERELTEDTMEKRLLHVISIFTIPRPRQEGRTLSSSGQGCRSCL